MFRLFCIIKDFKSYDPIEVNLPYGIDKDTLIISRHYMNIKINGKIHRINPNVCLYYPAGSPIYSATSDDYYHYYQIQFFRDRSFLTDSFLPASKPIILRDPEHILNMIDLIAYENILEDPNHETIIDYMMRSLLLKIRSYTKTMPDIPFYDKLVWLRQQIYQYPEKNWELSDIADRMHISSGYLYRLYKKAFMVTCKQDTVKSRIQAACHLLTYSRLSVSQIAAHTGYNNTEHFCRQFKKYVLLTPAEYRNTRGDIYD